MSGNVNYQEGSLRDYSLLFCTRIALKLYKRPQRKKEKKKRPGTDHVISRLMRGLKKTAPNVSETQTWQLYDWIGPVGPIQWKQKFKFSEKSDSCFFIIKFLHTGNHWISIHLRISGSFIPHKKRLIKYFKIFWSQNHYWDSIVGFKLEATTRSLIKRRPRWSGPISLI